VCHGLQDRCSHLPRGGARQGQREAEAQEGEFCCHARLVIKLRCEWKVVHTCSKFSLCCFLYLIGLDIYQKFGCGLDDRGSVPDRGPPSLISNGYRGIFPREEGGVKLSGREADHSPPSSAEVKNAWSYAPFPQYVITAWSFVKLRDNFMLTLQIYCWKAT